MRIIEKMKEKIKNDERFIGKMVGAILLSLGFAATSAGIYAAHNAVENDEIEYTENTQYVAGVIAVTAGSASMSLGVAGLIDAKEDEDEAKYLPFYDKKHGSIRIIEKPENMPDGKPSMSGPIVDPYLFNGEQKNNNEAEEQKNLTK